ncbi:M20/M25/M40 family metallo-hydrolase [Nocardioides speluncae]|uniref:M20/M25/M40 family metallo-hydrolase n=1 Tax=Nocardioides speluncae TaxID=2670337 RepID=UPI001F0B83D8|nr:M20/M25/M40 family metallo-hydrolase [Nocardioides speluncae]
MVSPSPLRPLEYDALKDRAVAKLQALVRIPTVSDRDPDEIDKASFDRFLEELRHHFPLLHKHLDLTRIHTHGLLFHWPGLSDQRPVVLMAHLDVVPVEGEWQHHAFGADLVDAPDGSPGGDKKVVWGRGTLDDKGCLTAICEAVERLLERGHTPNQDLWLSFGADEEVSGKCAPKAVEHLRERGVRPWFVLDEGGAVAHEAFPGVKPAIAVIGVTEKGVTSVELRVEGRGGHASTPAKMGPTARLARAILRLEKAPFHASAPAPTIELISRIAPHAPGPMRAIMKRASNRPNILTRALIAAGPESAAMTRTTATVTTLQGSPALNVIASTAKAGVNIRIMVGDTVATVMDHLSRAVHDKHVHLDVIEANEPSPISPYDDDDAFRLLESTIAEAFPDAVASPYVQTGATDSRFFTAICERVYRFAPFRMSKAQRQAIHSYDEYLGVDAFAEGVLWYERLIEQLPD